jgi:hypothetical protein
VAGFEAGACLPVVDQFILDDKLAVDLTPID